MTRVADYPIHTQFTERWSPRAFTGESIPQETLLSFFEAARWAPSAYNSQPWRFLYARRDTPDWERFLGLLNEFNRGWAQHASALVIIASKTDFIAPGATEETPALWHTFDTGSAWGHLALQASLSGWHTHGMAGFDQELTRKELRFHRVMRCMPPLRWASWATNRPCRSTCKAVKRQARASR